MTTANTIEVKELPLAAVHPDPTNDRADLGDLDGLTASIKAHGILQPLEVASTPDGWTIVYGHRRHAAAKAAKIKTVPCIVRSRDADELHEARLVENLHRADLSPLEEARGYQRLIDDHGYSQRKLATRVGVKQPHISKRLKLLKLPDDVLGRVGSTDADGITIEDALDLAKLVGTPKRLKKALKDGEQHGNLGSWVRRELADLERERRRAKAIKDVEATGATYIDKAASWLGYGDDVGPTELQPVTHRRQVDVDTHDQLDCHAVTLNWNDDPVPVCTDPSSHPEKEPDPVRVHRVADEDLDPEALARRQAYEREQTELRDADERRQALGRQVVAQVDAWAFAGDNADLARHLVMQLLEAAIFDLPTGPVFELLGVDDPPQVPDISWTEYDLIGWIGDDDTRLAQAATAAVFTFGDPGPRAAEPADEPVGRGQHRHLDWLARDHGYEPSALEFGIRPDEEGEAA